MSQKIEIVLSPELSDIESHILNACAEKLKIQTSEISDFIVNRKAIDARGRFVKIRQWVTVAVKGEKIDRPEFNPKYHQVHNRPEVHIVGAGPAGLFAALALLEHNMKPVIIERGKNVRERRRDLATLNKEGLVNPESNYCFGEGGAGTYSDGKLYTRSKKRGDVEAVFQTFVHHGANPDILVNARPHIGTNKLPEIISAISKTITDHGGEILFNTKLTDLAYSDGELKSITLNGDQKIDAKHLIVATGHSANDIYELFDKKKLTLEAKPFALGLRVEHPQELIDSVQYRCDSRGEFLPPAYYSLVEQVQDRGVFSFCMCPGGIIAPCATENNEIVVNGWSPSKRNNPYANSGMVVQLFPEDFGTNSPLDGLKYRAQIEQKAFEYGGGNQKAPGQRLTDFVYGKSGSGIPQNSYIPGVTESNLLEILPQVVGERLQQGFKAFGGKMRGYISEEAVVVGVESRTSSPVRIPRDKENFMHPDCKGIYPCGEGAGFAGGIASAAVDGINCALAIMKNGE